MFNGHCSHFILHWQIVLLSQVFLSSALATQVKPHAGNEFKEKVSSRGLVESRNLQECARVGVRVRLVGL